MALSNVELGKCVLQCSFGFRGWNSYILEVEEREPERLELERGYWTAKTLQVI